MNNAYSNKALPRGTVLREWRLEEVLGVGGFGIVYKGRGIYFDELVAIKEYFPSAISERKDGDTVVPIDSNAEEVHALGLKKFVEEAKLLWNLSTPTRHPNIVSVRSLFEIHGTAYIVMDFEDGFSLSKLLKQGKRFNEKSLLSLIQPIAEGLDRAHRVGVLHRDIKPPNILVNEDGRPVLIDFGSARFESGDATNTKVTFHTPPYAAIEQYVRTYAQGPWTDIYALGVVMHECVTGEKPPEVLERMHGGLGTPLADGHWPGYSRTFLAAIDAAMIIRPDERPQSISEWLALFDANATPAAAQIEPEDDEDATRIFVFDPLAEGILPVAPPPAGFSRAGKVETPVPSKTSEVEFKGPGQHTNATKKAKQLDDLPQPPTVGAVKKPAPATAPAELVDKVAMGAAKPIGMPRSKRPILIGAVTLGVAALASAGYFASQSATSTDPELAAPVATAAVAAIEVSGTDGLAAALQTLAEDARKAEAPAAAISNLAAASVSLASLSNGLAAMTDQGAKSARTAEMNALARSASSAFASALLRAADSRSQDLRGKLAWANPLRPNAARAEPAARQKLAGDLRNARSVLAAAVAAAGSATEPAPAIGAAQQALAASGNFAAAFYRASRAGPSIQLQVPETVQAPASLAPSPSAAATTEAPEDRGKAGTASELFPSKYRSFGSAVSAARGIAANVIRMGNGAAPGRDASDSDKEGHRIRQANVRTANEYVRYLDTLTNSMRGVRTEREVDQLIASANQTKGYLSTLQSRSSATK